MLTSPCDVRRRSPNSLAQDGNQAVRDIFFESELAQVADRPLDVVGGPLEGDPAIVDHGVTGSGIAVPRLAKSPTTSNRSKDSAASTASSAGQIACKSEITRARIDASLVARLARPLDTATRARAQKNSYRQLPR